MPSIEVDINTVRERFFHKLLKRIDRLRGVRPLVSRRHDIELLRRVHKRVFPRFHQIRHIKKILTRRESQIFHISLLIFVVSIVWSGMILINTQRQEIAASGGRHIEGVVGSLQRVNPLFASVNDVDKDLVRLVYSGLMRYNSQQQLVPDLAASYQVSEDEKVYTFKLREDVLWHDEQPFTAYDVVFTIETIQNPLVSSPLRVAFDGIAVEAVDDYTVTFTLSDPFQPFLSSLVVGIIPEHIWIDISPERVTLAQKNIQPIGTGPFMFKKFAKDETGFIYSYELKRFESYYDELPYLEEFAFRFFPEYEGASGAISAIREQKIGSLNYVPYDLREKVERKNIELRTLRLPQYTALFFNQKNQPVLEDKNVRTALTIALDKDRIISQSIGGEGQVIDSPLLPGSPGHNPDITKVPYSVSDANDLLDKTWSRISAADYRELRKADILKSFEEELKKEEEAAKASEAEGEEGDTAATNEHATSSIRLALEERIEKELDQELHEAQTFYRKNKDDNILTITIVTSNTPEFEKASKLIAGYWQEIGVNTRIEYVSSKDITREVLKTRKYDVLLYGLIVGENPDQYPFWHSSQIDFPGLNLSRYVNRKLDGILEKARETTDEEERKKLYIQFQDIVLDAKPAIFLYTPIYTYATTDKIKGLTVTNIFSPTDRFADVTKWYVKTKKKWKNKN